MGKPKATLSLLLVGIVLMTCACMNSTQSPEPEAAELIQTAAFNQETTPTQIIFVTFSSEKYSFQIPAGYTITPPTTSFPALTLEKERNKRLEIFQMEDFGRRPIGFTGEESQEEVDGYLPKETLTVGSGDKEYDVWIYYSENDAQTQAELKAIYNSITIK